jgi:hypothetical protein
MESGPRKMEKFPIRCPITKRMRIMPVIATIHLRPIGEEKRGQLQTQDFFVGEAGLLMNSLL